ncbi:metal-dependent amidase/aminoacylase/carboxypeptidase [Thozetella sp. PMI_491]|nr:metal-dependent amidase/aminoacylase/carboxypeptidase [Thozetella sp. PMI_491]
MTQSSFSALLSTVQLDLAPYEELYKHLHANPELSNQEKATAETAAGFLGKLNAFKIFTGIGGHGVAAVLENGPGKTILLRSDLDGLPVKEETGLPYASTARQVNLQGEEKPVMHACGHDMHITCLLGAAEVLVALRASWSGTLVLVFQPAEERGTGAKAMVDDGLYDRVPVPDYVLGQHLMPMRAGMVGCRPGTIMASADSFKVTLYGRGGHGSTPHRTIDPVMMASNLVVRLQNIVSREVDPSEMAVVTVGSLQAGHTENIIVDHAELGLDIRTVTPAVRDQVIAAIKRMIKAEFIASGAEKEPVMVETRYFPATDNDKAMAASIETAFAEHFGDRFNPDIPRVNASEDVSILASSQGKPSIFWFFGGVEPALWDEKVAAGKVEDEIPFNHSARFAPTPHPTIQTGIDALSIGALTFFAK